MDTRRTLRGYTVVGRLGEGPAGVVDLARNERTGRLFAVKRLSRRLVNEPGFIERFRGEAELLQSLKHPNVATLVWYEEADGAAEIGLELIDGVSLRQIIEGGALEPEAALVVLSGSLHALYHAHKAGVVHRDYKPENVVVDGEGVSHLIDFGIAVRTVDRDRAVVGTPRYMAPEQWNGEQPTPSTDVYAATAVFFECLTGHRPFPASGIAELREQHLKADPPVAAVPEPVRGLVERGLAKRPELRYATAGLFLIDLEAAAAAGYGPDWAARGRRSLAAAALALGTAFPLAATAAGVGGGLAAGAVTGPALRKALDAPPPTARGLGARLAIAGAIAVIGGTGLALLIHQPGTSTQSIAQVAQPPGASAPKAITPDIPRVTGPGTQVPGEESGGGGSTTQPGAGGAGGGATGGGLESAGGGGAGGGVLGGGGGTGGGGGGGGGGTGGGGGGGGTGGGGCTSGVCLGVNASAGGTTIGVSNVGVGPAATTSGQPLCVGLAVGGSSLAVQAQPSGTKC